MDRAQVNGLAITNHDLKIDLRRADSSGEWMMKSPFADRADVALIDQVMTGLETLRTGGHHPRGRRSLRQTKLADFGLQTPRLHLQVTPKGGAASSELIFGNDTVIEGKTYLQVSGRNDVYVVGSELKKLLDKDVNAWRDHRLTELRRHRCQQAHREKLRRRTGVAAQRRPLADHQTPQLPRQRPEGQRSRFAT